MTRTSTRISARPPTRLERLFFEEPKQFGLQARRHLADFVQEHGAAVGGFEQPALLLAGVGERAPFVAKQFAFEQLLGKRGHRDVDKWPTGAVAVVMDGLGRQVLPVPVSPVRSTVDAGLPATRASSVLLACIAGDDPMMASNAYSRPWLDRSARTSRRNWLVSSAFSTSITTSSRLKGLLT
jgi:hypothetical protein